MLINAVKRSPLNVGFIESEIKEDVVLACFPLKVDTDVKGSSEDLEMH